MIFGKINLEKIVQVNDKTRLNCVSSYTINEADISLVRIKPEDSESFYSVTSTKYLDWSYATAGDKTITLEITTDGAPQTFTKTLTIISEEDDRLFSSDSDIIPHEDDILNYVIAGRDSFLDKHRIAQERIMTYLNDQRIWDSLGNKLTPSAIMNVDEVRDWSKFLTLSIIFNSISNQAKDIFSLKAKKYEEMANSARSTAVLRLDKNDDSVQDSNTDVFSARIYRR
jgi:hypothetical protein